MKRIKSLLYGLLLSAILYLLAGISISKVGNEFNDYSEPGHRNAERRESRANQIRAPIDDGGSLSGSVFGSISGSDDEDNFTRPQIETEETGFLTLDVLEKWRLEAVDGIPDTAIQKTSPGQSKLLETRKIILKNNNQMKTNCPKTDFEFIVILQVHNRIDFLQILLKSLRAVKDINTALVVISVDIFDEKMNEQIRQTLQAEPVICFSIIYHPFSMAFYKDQYPAQDSNDCSRDQKIKLDKCNSKAKADMYGHYREVQFSQIKLHWAWKLNFIREKLLANTGFSFKYFILLEEDHFLLPDALHVAKSHILPKVEECDDKELCLGLLGIYPKTFKVIPHNDGITKSIWISGKHNMGMIVTLKWIENLVKNAHLFCNHDDYNWDFSLMKVSQGQNWKVIYPLLPRVYHMGGECGYHTKLHTCDYHKVQKTLDDALDTRKHLYFPKSLKYTNIGGSFPKKFKGYGGWGDVRDRRLCLRYFNMNTNS